MQISLQGKSALVTGGTRGIGKTIVKMLAQAGANVAFTYRSSAQIAEEFVKEIEAMGVKSIAIQSDASNFAQAQEAVNKVVEVFGALDILVNNAGITKDTLLLRMTEEQWDDVVQNNLKSVFNYTKAASRPMMQKKAGRIINIGSIVGIMGNAGQANYAATKAGMIGFTKSVAKEFASRNILVNTIAPGWISTDMTEKLSEDLLKKINEAIPLKKAGDAEDVANAVLFLASDMAKYITGETLKVDGGMAM